MLFYLDSEIIITPKYFDYCLHNEVCTHDGRLPITRMCGKYLLEN